MLYVPTDEMPVDEEHLESIPWSSLVAQTENRPWLVYVAAGAVVALVLGLLVARSFGPSATAPIAPAATVAPVVTAAPSTTLLSEADLRAELTAGPSGWSSAEMRAEWFVADYFTRDGAGGRDAELAGALGRPAPQVEPGATTYVEWARAWSSEDRGDGRFRVSVAFRAITDTEAGFVRGLVRGVAVTIQVGAEGGTRVVDLPEPIALPAAPMLAPVSDAQAVPETVALEALAIAHRWGDEATVIEGRQAEGAWQVTVTVADEHGARWPVVVPVVGFP